MSVPASGRKTQTVGTAPTEVIQSPSPVTAGRSKPPGRSPDLDAVYRPVRVRAEELRRLFEGASLSSGQ